MDVKFISKLYLKSFLFYALSFAILMFLWEYFSLKTIDPLKHIISASLFGLIMSWSTITAHKRSLQKLGQSSREGFNEEDLKVHQKITLRKKHELKEIFTLLNNNQATARWTLKHTDNKISAKTGISWASWGEKIEIKETDETFEISSRPILSSTLFDKGKNRENVILLKQLIENL